MSENQQKSPILVVDDDRTLRHVLKSSLTEDGFEVALADDVASCLSQIEATNPTLVLLDLHLPDGSGMEVLQRVHSAQPDLPIVLITAEEDSDSAIEASRHGAQDYLTKPLDLCLLRATIDRALSNGDAKSEGSFSVSPIQPCPSQDSFIGKSREMQEVFKNVGRVARQKVAVLIRGESGTGKELVARAIWLHSDRANKTFMAVNCAAMTNELLESELFGHEKGAFTGADKLHVGKFEACAGGTLFLDEVGDMHPAMQAKLLRVLQERTFSRVGGQQELVTDARIISATNRDLRQMCGSGEFREDLYHRLNGFSIVIPPLRDRGDDVRLLLGHYLHRYNQKLNKRITAISAEAAELLEQYPWPGNVREVESLLGQAMLNAQGSVIEVSDFPQSLIRARACVAPENADETKDTPATAPSGEFEALVASLLASEVDDVYATTIEFVEKYLLGRMLEQTNGNQSAAASRLGITRGSLRFKLKQLGMSIDSKVRVPHRAR